MDQDRHFHKGIAISVWQNSSDTASQWTQFVKDRDHFGQQRHQKAFTHSNDFWNQYETDIKLMKDLGATSFRFSFEWARVEPQPGQIDEAAIAKYHQILDCLEAHGMAPNATLHHFTHPLWFEQLGGFSNSSNNALYVRYARTMFTHFGSRIRLWATFNEPTCFAFCGYIMGLWAPGKRFRFVEAGRVLGNLLRCHVGAYQAIKVLPGGSSAHVGMVHQHIRFVPKCNWLTRLWVRPLCRWMTYWFATGVMLDFFRTGHFSWKVPFRGTVIRFHEPAAASTVDWWGINYYTRPAITGLFQMTGLNANEPMTDMGMPMVASDLYYHINHASTALNNPPIYITETGLADKSDTLRAQLIQSYYAEILRAIAHGHDVRGTYFWTLMDNIEWHHGFKMKFGLYAWDPARPCNPDGSERVRLREGSRALAVIHSTWPDDRDSLRQYAQQQMGTPGAGSQRPRARPLGVRVGNADGNAAIELMPPSPLATNTSNGSTDLRTSLLDEDAKKRGSSADDLL